MLMRRIAACALAIMMLCTAFAIEAFAAGEPSFGLSIEADDELAYFIAKWSVSEGYISECGIFFTSTGFKTTENIVTLDTSSGKVTPLSNSDIFVDGRGGHMSKEKLTSKEGTYTVKAHLSDIGNATTVYAYAYAVYVDGEGNSQLLTSEKVEEHKLKEEDNLTHPDGATAVELTSSTVTGLYGNNSNISVNDGIITTEDKEGFTIALGGEYTSIKMHFATDFGASFRVWFTSTAGDTSGSYVTVQDGESTVILTSSEACGYIVIKGASWGVNLTGTLSHICLVGENHVLNEAELYFDPSVATGTNESEFTIGLTRTAGKDVDDDLKINVGETMIVHMTGYSDGDFRVWFSKWGEVMCANPLWSAVNNGGFSGSGEFDIVFELTCSPQSETSSTVNAWSITVKGASSSTPLNNFTLTHIAVVKKETATAESVADEVVEVVEKAETVENVATAEDVEAVEPAETVETVKPVERVEPVMVALKRFTSVPATRVSHVSAVLGVAEKYLED